MSRLLRISIRSLVIYALTSPVALTQETELSQEAEPTTPSRPIEEITVLGEQTLHTLRLEVEAAEEEVFAKFNELNSDDDFDISCTREVYTGSHLPVRDCMPKFLRNSQADNVQNYLLGIDIQLTRDQLQSEVYGKSVELEAEMRRVAIENEEFFLALQKLTDLVAAYAAKKK
ncbi:MAG: hypothetical protein O2971_09350 [Proteobacteria bacterium]|nr:hypothetical protein [Pseudomonadota bacterium]